MDEEPEYIGDAIYVIWEPEIQRVILKTKNLSGRFDNVIFLEKEVYGRLFYFIIGKLDASQNSEKENPTPETKTPETKH